MRQSVSLLQRRKERETAQSAACNLASFRCDISTWQNLGLRSAVASLDRTVLVSSALFYRDAVVVWISCWCMLARLACSRFTCCLRPISRPRARVDKLWLSPTSYFLCVPAHPRPTTQHVPPYRSLSPLTTASSSRWMPPGD